MNKKNIILFLFGLSVFLLIINIALKSVQNKSKTTIDSVNSILDSDYNFFFIQKLDSLLSDYGLDSLVKKVIKTTSTDTLYNYTIKIPSDIIVPSLIVEISNMSKYSNLDFSSTENNNTYTIFILNNDKRFITVIMNYDRSIARQLGKLGLFIDQFELLKPNDRISLLEFPENLSILLNPSKSHKESFENIKINNKSFSVLITDDIKELEFKFNTSYSKQRLVHSVKNIVANFKESRFFFVDKDAEIYNSTILTTVESEFNKRGFELIPTYRFDYLEGENNEVILHKFNVILKKILKGENRIVVVSYDNLKIIQKELSIYKKKGIVVVDPNVLIKI